MPAVADQRRELYAQGLAKGMTEDAAYEAAGFVPNRANASRCANRDDVKRRVAELQGRAAARVEMDLARTLREVARLAVCDIRQGFDDDGALLPLKDWPDDFAAAVASVQTSTVTDKDGNTTTRVDRLRFWNKGEALDKLMKHFSGYAPEKIAMTDTEGQDIEADPLELARWVAFTLARAVQDRAANDSSLAPKNRGGEAASA